MDKKQKQTNEVFKNDNYKPIPSTLYTATYMQYVDKQGNTIEVPISSDFKLLYGFLFDQCRSFKAQAGVDGEGQDLYQDWDTIFRVIGRKYTGDKTSLKLVKLLEDAGILVQTKRINTTSTIKHVFDVSIIPTIKFSNPEHDSWVKEQGQRRADRQRQYAEQKKNKLAAIEEAKKQHSQKVQSTDTKGVNEQPVKPVGQPEPKEPEPVSKQDDLPDPFLDDCGVSHDDMFEEYSHAKPTKHSHHHEPGRLCDKCFRDRNGEWDCRDDFCQNCIPF
ncbi:hypothetical protein [Aeromonas sobria]|uniref:hypothetical protein n=1 Tax=Aeromonas sobria TaxID=646 RepID=UPI001119CFFE|nr:hypothetical protein [Aeromonas sobria]